MSDPLLVSFSYRARPSRASAHLSPHKRGHHGTRANAGFAQQISDGFRVFLDLRRVDTAGDEQRIEFEPLGAGDVGLETVAYDERPRRWPQGACLGQSALEHGRIGLA